MRSFLLIFFLSVQLVCVAQTKTIHILVALCDNKYQGIVPVPAKIGNGQDPKNNLYWGCGYGVKSFFKKQAEWKLIKEYKNVSNYILERIVFKHISKDIYIVADAYDGAYIKQTTTDLIDFCAGKNKDTLRFDSYKIPIGGSSQLICYTGHNGLMDFKLDKVATSTDKLKREVIILACYSKSYFKDLITKAGALPLIWSTHLMSPEAYTTHAAITGWVANETPQQIKERSAQAYNKYLKCGIKGARNLLVTGQ